MNKRIRYFISPTDDGWKLQKQGAGRATKAFDTKEKALDFARPFVREQADSQLIIQKQNGVIQTEHTYGHDPKKTPG